MEKERKKYPIGAEHYTLYEEVGTGVSASVHRAFCESVGEIVAIKILDFERNNCDLVISLLIQNSINIVGCMWIQEFQFPTTYLFILNFSFAI